MTECSLCARLGTRDSRELRHSPCHCATHRLLGKKDSESIFIQKNMVNAMMGLSMGVMGTERSHKGEAGKGMVMPELSLKRSGRNNHMKQGREKGNPERKERTWFVGDRLGHQGTTVSSVGYKFKMRKKEQMEPTREACRMGQAGPG